MHEDNTRPGGSRGSLPAEGETPADLRAVERLLDRLGAHDRACSPFGMEERIALGSGAVGRSLDSLVAAEMAMADAGLEGRVFAGTRGIVDDAVGRIGTMDAPAGLEERIFEATRGVIVGKALRSGSGSDGYSGGAVLMRIGVWSARLAAVLSLGGGVWLASASFRGGGAGPEPVEVAAADAHDLSFDEFDEVLTSHMAFMQTVEYEPADVDVLDEDWCTSCELIEIEEEISS